MVDPAVPCCYTCCCCSCCRYCFLCCRYFCCFKLLLFAAGSAVVAATVVSCLRPFFCSFPSPEESPSCLVSSQSRHVHVMSCAWKIDAHVRVRVCSRAYNYNLCAHLFLGRVPGRPTGSEHSSAQTWSCKPPGDEGMQHRRMGAVVKVMRSCRGVDNAQEGLH